MLSRVEIQNSLGDTLALPLADTSGGYLVKDISGLDPVKATLVSTTIAQIDGAQLQSTRRETRNITMRLGFVPNFYTTDVRSLRQNLYGFLMPKSLVTLRFFFDEVLYAVTVAAVETFESSMFSVDPEVNVSLICYDPDFYAPTTTTFNGTTVIGTSSNAIQYDGTSDAGFVLTLSPNASIADFAITVTHPDNKVLTLDLAASLLSGDTVVVNTIPGSKAATLTRSSSSSSLLYAVSPLSIWMGLSPGQNLFRVSSTVSGMPYSLVYTKKYGAL